MNFTAEQDRAITSQAPRICVDAGAGSGKTRVLVERIVHLVDQREVPLEQIAAITFTDKAAAEMKARLRATFRKRAQEAEDDPGKTTYWRGLEQRVDTARITTIHSFCTGFLREYALHIGLDPDFSVLGNAEAALLLSDTVRAALIGLLEAQDADALHLVAEYGTVALRETLEAMLRQGTLAGQALARHDYSTPDTLYASWAGALERELMHRVRREAVDPYLDRLHHFGGACSVESDGREALRTRMILTLGELRGCNDIQRARKLLWELDFNNVRGLKKNWADEVAYEGISALQNDLRDWARRTFALAPTPETDLPAARTACALRSVCLRAATAWTAARAQANALDFDTLIQETTRVLGEHAAVRKDAARALRHLLIDEFQDTDSAQLAIAELLCGEPGGPDFFFVGDPKQSIYDFRGAEVELFGLQRAAAVDAVALADNFRTLPAVLGFINGFFERTLLLRAVGTYARMQAGRRAPEGDACPARVEFFVVPNKDADGEKRKTEALRREEARWIAARIQQLCAPGAPPIVHDDATGQWRVPRFGDFALLFRAMSSLYIYEGALRDAGVDFISSAGAGFYRRQEVLDVVNALRLTVDPGDGAALAAFLRGPLVGVSDDALVQLVASAPLLEAFASDTLPTGLANDDAAALAHARALINELRARMHFAPADILLYLYEATGIEAIALNHHYGLQKASNLRKLLALAREFSRGLRPSLARFVRYVAEIAGHEAIREGEALLQPLGGGAVSLMSIHKSKGLQFPIVFVCDTAMATGGRKDAQLFLHRELGLALRGTNALGESTAPAIARAITARATEKAEAESARLLYVAMTRAQDYLIVCGRRGAHSGTWFADLANYVGLDNDFAGDVSPRGKVRLTHEVAQAETVSREAVDIGTVQQALVRLAQETATCPPPQSAISVSALLNRMATAQDDEDDRDTGHDDPAPRRGGHGLARGSVVHRLFELWDFRGDPPIAAAMAGAPFGPRARRELATDLATLAGGFAALPSHALLRESDVKRELPFALRLGEVIVHGTIDALADGVLLDFKTGRFDEQKHARYTLQLQLYAAALAQLDGAPLREARLVYVDVPREDIVDIAAPAIAAALAQARAVLS